MIRPIPARVALLVSLLLLLLPLAGSALGAPPAASGAKGRFDALLERATRERWESNPSLATFMGIHTYDSKLENTTKAAIQSQTAALEKNLRELHAIDKAALDSNRQIDYDLFESDLNARVFRLAQTREWEKDPGTYGYGWALENLIARDFAPPSARLRSVIARLEQVPRQLQNGRTNLKNPPRMIAEFAAEDFEGMIGYLDTDVPKAFASVKDPALWKRYDAAKKGAQEATRAYVKWIKDDLIPRANGTFVLGEDAYRKRLLYEEMIDLPLDSILAIGSRELARLETRYHDAASRIAPGAPLDSVVAMMRRDHPTRDGLLDEVRALLGDLRDYCVASKFIGIPSTTPLKVRPTPEYAASRSFASFDGPGPLETKARDSYYNVTLPGATWDAARVEEHLQGYSRWSLPSVSIHECYPGHFVHSLYMPNAPSLARKTMGCSSFGEGWGLYTEEALFDHGYAKGDPKKEFGMLRWALVRSCRLQAGIRVHTRGMTIEEATQLFMDHAGLEKANAQREAYRAAFDPLYVVYTIGAMQIRKLRDDVRAKEGASFDLAKFHERILSQGSLPVALLRRIMLEDNGPTL
ncbi:MAG TPA: DUF885 domain-containing protein [Candidatus Eisenbacteria bacterium]|jgi:uncharacterized protein (DUF885 family)|nr:DUF885 domain-containing protein [Candidatus Eisenbacteria bacterium]